MQLVELLFLTILIMIGIFSANKCRIHQTTANRTAYHEQMANWIIYERVGDNI
jgi:hypothetical protein